MANEMATPTRKPTDEDWKRAIESAEKVEAMRRANAEADAVTDTPIQPLSDEQIEQCREMAGRAPVIITLPLFIATIDRVRSAERDARMKAEERANRLSELLKFAHDDRSEG